MRPGWILRLCAFAGYTLLLSPVLVVFVISFSAGDFLTFPPPGLSTRWYAALLSNAELMAALRNSAVLALSVAGIAVLAGAPAAYAIARLSFPGRDTVAAMLTAPLLLPTLVLGLALLLALQPAGLAATWPGLMLAHSMLAVPFAVRIMTTAFAAIPRELEEAAWTLGATPLRAALRVTLPVVAPGVFAAAALCFLVSFDETVISLFLVGPRLSTLPVEMFRYAENRTDPLVAALAMALIGVALAVVLLVERLVGFTRALGRE